MDLDRHGDPKNRANQSHCPENIQQLVDDKNIIVRQQSFNHSYQDKITIPKDDLFTYCSEEQLIVVNQNYIPQDFEGDQTKCCKYNCCCRDQSPCSQAGVVSVTSKEQQISNDRRDQDKEDNSNPHCVSSVLLEESVIELPSVKSQSANDTSPSESLNGSTKVKRVKEALIRGRDYVRSKVSACKQKLPSIRDSLRLRGSNPQPSSEPSTDSREDPVDDKTSQHDSTNIHAVKRVIFNIYPEGNHVRETEETSHDRELADCKTRDSMPGLHEETGPTGSDPNHLTHAEKKPKSTSTSEGSSGDKHVVFEDSMKTSQTEVERHDNHQSGNISTIPEEDLDGFPLGTEAQSVTGPLKKILRKSYTCAPAIQDSSKSVDKRLDWLIGRESMPGSFSSDTSQITTASNDSVNSVDALLSERSLGPDDMLRSLGFCMGMESNNDISRIPERFFQNTNTVSGNNINQFLLEPDELQHLLNVMESQRSGHQLTQQSFRRPSGMWNPVPSFSSVLHGLKFISAARSVGHQSMHGDTPVENSEQLASKTYSSILHPDNRKELAHQGFYDHNSKTATSNSLHDRNATGANKRQQLQTSMSITKDAEERRRVFQKSRALKNRYSSKNNDSSSIESDDQESYNLPRKTFDLRSFSTDWSDSVESSDSSFSHEPLHSSPFKPAMEIIQTKDEIQKLKNDVELLQIGKKRSVSFSSSAIAEVGEKLADQINPKEIDDADYVLAPMCSREPSSIENCDSASVNVESQKKLSDLDFADYAQTINHSSDLSKLQNSERDQMQNKKFVRYEENTVFKFGVTNSLEVPGTEMERSDSDATITVMSPDYLSDTGSDLNILESSISHGLSLSKGEKPSSSRMSNSTVVSEEEQIEKRKVWHDENFNIKDQTIDSKPLQQMESDSSAVVNMEDTTSRQPGYFISQVEKVCGYPEDELTQDQMLRRGSGQLPRMESAQSDSSGFAEADIFIDHYSHDGDTVKLGSLGSSAESDKTFRSTVTVLHQPQTNSSSQSFPQQLFPGEDFIGTSRRFSCDPNIPRLRVEKRQMSLFRETIKIPVKSYKTNASERSELATRPYSQNTKLNSSLLVNMDHSYYRERPICRRVSYTAGENVFVSQCHFDVTSRGSFGKKNYVVANNSTVIPSRQEDVIRDHDRSRSVPYIYYPGHVGGGHDRAKSIPCINHPRIEEEDQHNPDLKSSEIVNHDGASQIIFERHKSSDYQDNHSHMISLPRSNSAFITPASDQRKPVCFTANQNPCLASDYQNNLQASRFQSRHMSISQIDRYPNSSSTFSTSVQNRQRSVGNIDFHRIRSPIFVQNRQKSVGSFDFYRNNSPSSLSSLSETREIFPSTWGDNLLFIPREQFKGSQSSLGSNSDYSYQSSLENFTCRDEDINYIKLIKLVNQPMDAKKYSISSLSVVHYRPKHRLRTWPTLEKAQHLEEETQLVQCAAQRYKTEIHSMEAMRQTSYRQAFDSLDDDEKEEVEELMSLWEDLRREVSEMEQLLAGRMYGVISGNDNFNSMLGLSVIQQMTELMKEQICQQQLNYEKNADELFYKEEISQLPEALGRTYGSRPSLTTIDPLFRQKQLEDDLSMFRQTVLQDVRDEMRDKTTMMQVELQSKENEIQRLQMEILMKNMQDERARNHHVLESDI